MALARQIYKTTNISSSVCIYINIYIGMNIFKSNKSRSGSPNRTVFQLTAGHV